MHTVDQRATLSHLYKVSAKAPVSIDVPDLTVLAIEGTGDPAVSPLYQASVQALMTMAWGIRAHLKASDPPFQIKVMPLEGEWTLPGIPFSEDPEVRAKLEWSLQIVQPEHVRTDLVEDVRAAVRKKKAGLARVDDVQLETVPGGPAATMLHLGPFSREPETIARIHSHIEASGREPILGHREIYLSDLRRVPPEKLRTILRVGIRR